MAFRVHLGRTLDGAAGFATEVIIDEHDRPDTQATLAAWFLHCPRQSPAWDKYLLAVIHLRPIEGVGDAIIRLPGATHEVLLTALNPEKLPVVDDPQTWEHLRPANVMEQVHLPSDEAAIELIEACARGILSGVLWAEPPLSGQKEPWHTSLIKTTAHMRGEEHAP